jgi:hypothetical protein
MPLLEDRRAEQLAATERGSAQRIHSHVLALDEAPPFEAGSVGEEGARL